MPWLACILAFYATVAAPAGHVEGSRDAATLVFEAINTERAKLGRAPLEWDDKLAVAARLHAGNMAAHRFFGHDDPERGGLVERLAQSHVVWRGCAENLFVSYGPFETRRAASEWMRSRGHKSNLLDRRFTHTGVGVVSARGDTYVVQIFAAY